MAGFLTAQLRADGTGKNGADRDRTDDLNVANVALSQLSYCPILTNYNIYTINLTRGQAIFGNDYINVGRLECLLQIQYSLSLLSPLNAA